MWSAIADMAIDDDERRSICGGLERLKSSCQHLQIIRVANARNVPTIGDEACCHIICKGQGSISFDGDMVVVIDPAKVRELQVTGQGGCFVADTFHHAAITANGVDIVVEHLKVGAV